MNIPATVKVGPCTPAVGYEEQPRAEQPPTPPIPRDHPLRDFYEVQRQAALMDQQSASERVQAFNRVLGYSDGTTAKERRRQARAGVWHGEEQQTA